jgi:eukaryotic-like serine/threonine-protein kinase
MPQALCPETHDLQRFLLGQLAAADADYLEQHLVHCHHCLGMVPALAAEDAVVVAMRAQAAGDEPEKDVVESLINRVRQLHPGAEGSALEPTPNQADDPSKTDVEGDEARTLDDPILAGRYGITEVWTGSGDGLRPSRRVEPFAAAGAPPGLIVPGYEILGELGRGGMAVVYKARQTSLNRLVALKMILSGPHAGKAERARFRSEAEAIARLQHPHIVQIYEIGDHEDRPYLALEFVEGGSLSQVLKTTPQKPGAAAQLVGTLARAMHAAHERGIIHRDLKPANVLLVPSDRPEAIALGSADEAADYDRYEPKITDFGLAKQLDKAAGQSVSGQIVGTPSYMSPEQAQARTKEVGPAADIYALGALLYDLLTGRPPFKTDTPADTMIQVIHTDPVPPSRLQPTVPHDLETICLKCLHKEPNRRYPSARALADDLARFLAGEPIQARPVSRWERGVKWARRRPVAAALAAVSVLAAISLMLGGFVWAEYQRQARMVVQGELERDRHIAGLREQVLGDLSKGDAALATGNWNQAKLNCSSALSLIGSEPGLADYRLRAQTIVLNAERGLAEVAASEDAQRRYRRFVGLRDQALFLESRLGSLDAGFNQKMTRAAARAGLDVFGIHPGGTANPVLDRHYSDAQKREILAGCYTLLLILAEAISQPLGSEDRDRQLNEALEQVLPRAVSLRPATRAYHQRRAKYLRQLGRQADAETEQRRADALKPEEAVDYFLLGDEAYQRGEGRQAIAYFTNTLRLEPEHFWARFLAAITYVQLGQPGLAEANLSVCQSRQPDFVWIYILRGFVYGQLGEQALRTHADAALHFAAAEQDFDKAMQLKPNQEATYNLLVNRGVTRIQQKKYAEAIADLQQAAQLRPDHFHAYHRLAQAYEEQKKYSEAITQLDRAIHREARLAILYHARGRLHLERQNPAKALPDFETAIRLAEAGSAAPFERGVLAEDHAQRGRILHQRGRVDEALAAYREALRIAPDYELALRSRGTLLYEQKRYQEAIKDFDAYLKKWRPVPEIYEVRGLAKAAGKDYDGAFLDYTQALNLEPTSARYALRGWIHLFREAPRSALRDFEEAIKLDGKNGDAFAGRGYAHVRLAHLKQAVADAGEALVRAQQTKRHLYNVARIYAQAAGQIKVDPRQPYRRNQESRFSYEERAVDLIRKALDGLSADQRVAFWHDYIEADAAFNPIRRGDGFAQLAGKYFRAAK